MRMVAILAIALVSLAGCGENEQASQMDSALQEIKSVQADVERLSSRLVACKTAIRVWSGGVVEEQWQQAGGAFFRSVSRN